MKVLYVLILLALMTSTGYTYDPMHNGGSGIDPDGDRNPGTQFDIDALGLSNERVAIIYQPEDTENTFVIDTEDLNPEGRIIDVTTLGACSSVAEQPNSCESGDAAVNAAINTLAFQKAITFVLTRLYDCDSEACTMDPANPGAENNYIIYVPNGVYSINDTLTYKTTWDDEPLMIDGFDELYCSTTSTALLYTTDSSDDVTVSCTGAPTTTYSEAIARIRIIGESRSGVVIKANGTGWNGKPMLSFGHVSSGYNSAVSMNTLRHLTLDANTSGASGVQFSGANNAGIHNVSIINGVNGSTYPDSGVLIKSAATQGYHSDITISGFARGINSTVYHATHNAFEHVTITGSGRSIQTQHSGLSLRKILVSKGNNAQPVWLTGAGQIVMVDSTIKKTSGSAYFDELSDVFNISSTGHVHTRGLKLESDEDTYAGDCSNVTEVATLNTSMNCAGQPSLAILPANPSRYDYSNLESVVFDGVDDNALSAVLDDIAEDDENDYILFFPKSTYTFSSQHVIPSNLIAINFLYGTVSTPNGYLFTVEGGSEDLVLIEDMTFSGSLFEHADSGITRPVVLRHIGGTGSPYRNVSGSIQNVYFESVNALGKARLNHEPIESFFDVNAWARGINTEYPLDTKFPIQGSSVWVFGYKTEKSEPAFSLLGTSNDKLEVLGGLSNQRGSESYNNLIAIENPNAEISFTAFTSGIGGGCPRNPSATTHFDTITTEDSAATKTYWEDYPEREIPSVYCNDIFIPLFTRDVDNDGLTNIEEAGSTFGTPPLYSLTDPDTDNDSILDGDEDADGDIGANWWELFHGFNPMSDADGITDADGESLGNQAEFMWGTDPWDQDTDGDEYDDHCEVIKSTDPLNPADHPASHDQDCPVL